MLNQRDAHGLSWAAVAFAVAAASAVAGEEARKGAEVTLLVRNQDTERDRTLFDELQASVEEAGYSHLSVVSMAAAEKEFSHHGLWTYKPWIYKLADELKQKTKRKRSVGGERWFVFMEPTTKIDLVKLREVLSKYSAREHQFIGRAIQDKEHSIIHHYSTEPPYPLVHSGFAVSGALLKHLAKAIEDTPLGSGQQIEPVWELASWLAKLGVKITDRSDAFCAVQKPDCSTWIATREHVRGLHISHKLRSEGVVIAVKTVANFHKSRLPLIDEFWGKRSAAQVLYLSNEDFSDIPGIQVVNLSPEFGSAVDPNKEATSSGSGHCSKMQSILQYFARHIPGKRWYVVTDDDTLLNVPQLLRVLDAHDDSKPLYVGERYGWAHREKYDGTNYITTGGGMAMTAAALSTLQSCSHCRCSSPNSPDDMTLGSWFRQLQVPVIHEEGFHQSEPKNYHPELLKHSEPPVSFHRYDVHLPAKTPQDELLARRKQNWKQWIDAYFKIHSSSDEL